jgi:hypothetical protein
VDGPLSAYNETKRAKNMIRLVGFRNPPLRLLTAVSISAASVAAGQVLETYRVQHRPAQELVAVAEAALGDQGRVTLDPRTATLILNGTAEAVRRTLTLLEEVDRPLRQLVLSCEVRRLSELEQAGVRVRWKIAAGSVRMGTLPLPIAKLRVSLGAQRGSTRQRFQSVLRVLEGRVGFIVTGEALPFVYENYWGGRGVDFIPAETGFEVVANMLGDGKVQIELRPFSGRFEDGGALRYTEAATSLTLSPGETMVVGEVSSQSEEKAVGLPGARTRSAGEREVLLVSVKTDMP